VQCLVEAKPPQVCCEWRCTFSNYVLRVGFAAVDFFNQVNLLYGTLTEFCTAENCPTMSAGPKYASWNNFFLQILFKVFLGIDQSTMLSANGLNLSVIKTSAEVISNKNLHCHIAGYRSQDIKHSISTR
jgi:hypothetical protein